MRGGRSVGARKAKLTIIPSQSLVGAWHSPSHTGQHCPRILPGYLQGAGGQGRGSHWTLPFCQQGPVSREQALSQALPARQTYSQHSGNWNRGPGSPPAPHCCVPAHLGNSLLGNCAQMLFRGNSPPQARPSQVTHAGPVLGTAGLPRVSVPLLTHHHTLGSRCPEGAWQGTDTDWHTPAGGNESGPPSKCRQRRDPHRRVQPRNRNGIRSPAIHSLEVPMG